MLFPSYEFLFFFLPLVLLGSLLLGARARLGTAWLVAASLLFYSWWNPRFLAVIVLSILFNYVLGAILARESGVRSWGRRAALTLGIGGNLGALGYFKYRNFLSENIALLTGQGAVLEQLVLPLGISFFTFQQIAFLLDAHRGETREYNFLDYCFFVTFFPQLIAGPIVHHAEIFPQFRGDSRRRPAARAFALGLTSFTIGLFKKVVLADGVALYATPIFDHAQDGGALSALAAWQGALAYTFQLYFDFSGYSDMAVGLSQMFGIKLPINFHSPYKATGAIEFWRRWHITLTRFITSYVFNPIATSITRFSMKRWRHRGVTYALCTALPVVITFLIAGLWHGAGWTFVIFGGLHGLYLAINHGWRELRRRPLKHLKTPPIALPGSWLLTFLAVVVAFVFFRAESVAAALRILGHMAGASATDASVVVRATEPQAWLWIGALLGLVLLLPSTYELTRAWEPALDPSKIADKDHSRSRLRWQPSAAWAVACAGLALASVWNLARVSEFIYFGF
ncbi:MAG: MBOAT family protein [Myxococcales bacterium]|nr:MBOAT family protein [Myxococcales bacterium]